LKLLDYLAYGMPVVATPLPDPLRVAQAGPGLVETATDLDAWLAHLDRAVAEPAGSPARGARLAYVEGQSAERRVASMLGDALTRA
jgi:hypothetical protein